MVEDTTDCKEDKVFVNWDALEENPDWRDLISVNINETLEKYPELKTIHDKMVEERYEKKNIEFRLGIEVKNIKAKSKFAECKKRVSKDDTVLEADLAFRLMPKMADMDPRKLGLPSSRMIDDNSFQFTPVKSDSVVHVNCKGCRRVVRLDLDATHSLEKESVTVGCKDCGTILHTIKYM